VKLGRSACFGPPLRALASIVCAASLAACVSGGGAGSPDPGYQTPAMGAAGQETDAARRARIRLELGASYYQQGNHAVALDELRQALAIDPGYAPAHGMLGLVHMALGDRARAEESFQRALRLAPGDSELRNNYGWFLCQTGRERESFAHFTVALKNPLYATPARPLHNAGICSLRLGDEAQAERYFLQSFQVDPRNPVAMFHLAEINLKRRDFERARFYTQRLLTSYEPSAQVLGLAFRVERAAGNREAAATHALQLRRRFPGSPEAEALASGRFGE
jgi:type IV pilus assembly protein PilF